MAFTRDSGPSGSAEENGLRYAIGGWELFEGDPANHHACHGWFRATNPGFGPTKGERLRLHLIRDEGDERVLDVEIVRGSTSEPVWEFIAQS